MKKTWITLGIVSVSLLVGGLTVNWVFEQVRKDRNLKDFGYIYRATTKCPDITFSYAWQKRAATLTDIPLSVVRWPLQTVAGANGSKEFILDHRDFDLALACARTKAIMTKYQPDIGG